MGAFRWSFMTGGIVAGLLALAIAAGAVWLNTFIHSDAFRHEVESRAAGTLGGPVQIEGIELGLFGGVQLREVTAQIEPEHLNGRGSVDAKVESVSCGYALLQLLRGRLELTGVTLVRPNIVLTPQSSAPLPAADASGTGTALRRPLPPMSVVLEKVKVTEGTLAIRDASGGSVADLQGLDVTADTSGYYEGKPVTAQVKVADIAAHGTLHVTDFSMPVTYNPAEGTVSARPIAGSAFGGNIAGDYELTTAPDPSHGNQLTATSILEMNARGLNMEEIGSAMNPGTPSRLTGSLDVESKWQNVESGAPRGEGDAQLTNGHLTGVPILSDLAVILRMGELGSPTLRRVQTHFQIADGITRFTGLQIDAVAFQMTGDGTVDANGALDAHMVLVLPQNALVRLPAEAAMFFVQQLGGSGSIGFHVGGTLAHPETDLGTHFSLPHVKVKNVLNKAFHFLDNH